MSGVFRNLDDSRLRSTDEAAKILGIDASTLRRYQNSKPPRGPAFYNIEGTKKYDPDDIKDYLRSRRIESAEAA